jgi:uncharacterized protein with HEPN domain
MFMSRDLASLVDVLGAVRQAIEFAQGLDREQFMRDKTVRWAVYSQLVIIGEAAGRISREFQQIHAALP